MKRVLLLVSIVVVIFSCDARRKDKIADDALQQMEAASKNLTTVELIDSVFNFGSITEGEKVEFSFRFRNTGKFPLVITNVSATCGCTIPEKPEQPIKTGETGFIKVVFNSKSKSGHQEKSITVSSNSNPAFNDLKLVGEVK